MPMINDKDNTISLQKLELLQLHTTNANLGIEVIQLQAWLDGNETLLNQTETWLGDNITYYNSQISSSNSQIANIQNQLNSLMDGTETSLDIIMSNPLAWVNKTVVVQGALIKVPPSLLPGNYWLNSSNGISQIGVLWNGAIPNSSQVQIHGVVRQETENIKVTNLNETNITFSVPYIEAETVNPI
jgi:hypothetical protein